MRLIVVTGLLSVLIYSNVISKMSSVGRIKLENGALHKLDGLHFGINADSIRDMLVIDLFIHQLQFGKKNSAGQRIGQLSWQKQLVTTIDLAQIETTVLTKEERKELISSLQNVKDRFMALTQQYSQKTALIKPFLFSLMQECCEKRQIMDSFILSWGKATSETEVAIFDKGIINFSIINRFFDDLTNYIKDLMYSCPKAFTQFEKKYLARGGPQLFNEHLST